MYDKKKLRWYSYRTVDGENDKPIYKYMELDHLIALFETNQLYVKRRRENEDANESYKNINLQFGFTAVGENVPPQPKAQERMVPYDSIVNLPTSCWTLDPRENYLMWKGYASKWGVRIKSSIHNFISSVEIDTSEKDHDKILCGSMIYEDFMPSTVEEKQLFGKDIAYADEREFRFYFNLPDDSCKKETKSIFIPILPNVLVDEVVVSPFFHPEASKKIVSFMKCCYNLKNVSPSKIKIKQ